MSPLYVVGDAIADAVNPALTIATIVVVVQELRRRLFDGVLCLFASTLGLAGIYAVGALEQAVWQPLGMDYSTHAAYASSLVISMLAWRRGWVRVLTAVGLGYLVLILVMGYHHLVEVIVGTVAGVIVTLPWHVLAHRVRRGGKIR